MFSRIVRAGVLAAMVALIAAPAVFAYQGQVISQLTVTSPQCVNGTDEITVTVTDVAGKPVTDQVVTWSADPPATVSPKTSTTNAQGVATTNCSIGPGESATITARAGDAFGQAVVKACEEGLPNTSTSPDGTPSWILAVVALAVFAGAATAAWRYALIHR
jgi:hypothetical protein